MSLGQEQFKNEVDTIEKTVETKQLVVHNDEVNTFDWVILSLVEVCDHTFEQAEQCAIIIDAKGKYAVKEGSYEDLKPIKEAIAERGINVTIQ